MSNQYPYGNDGYDDQTRQYRREDYGQPQYQQPQYQSQQYRDSYEDQGPSLLAGKFEAKIVTFAVVLIVDQLIAVVSDTVAQGPGAAVIHGVVAGILGVLAGLLYIPVSGTGNEGLFNAAIVALTVAAAVFYVIFGGLLDKDWSTLLSLAAVLCAGITAYAAPSRIETARVR